MKGFNIPQDAILIGKDGNKIIVHVNQKHIKLNATRGTKLPFYTVKVGGKTLYAWEVIKTGPSKLEDHGDAPLGCGARAYDVTYSPVILLNAEGNSFAGLTFTEATALYGDDFNSMEDAAVCKLPEPVKPQPQLKYADDLRAPHCGVGNIAFYNLKEGETVNPAGEWKEYTYSRTYHPSGIVHNARVACYNDQQAQRLMELWSTSKIWTYQLV